MKKYKVIPLSMGGLGNKIFNGGDIVTSANFPEGNVPKLIKEGFLKEHKESADEKKSRLVEEKNAKEAKELEEKEAKRLQDIIDKEIQDAVDEAEKESVDNAKGK